MTLLQPVVDDRTFQDLVDEAKRLIPRYCPEWTDHNVSDPGVALIELFAWMAEQLLYRLNHVSGDMYVRFLDLVGIRLQPGSPARTAVTFWLSAPQPEAVTIPEGTQVGTPRTEFAESVVFVTDTDLVIRPPELTACVTASAKGAYEDHWSDLRLHGGEVVCFSGVTPGDAVHFGFADSLAGNAIRLDMETPLEGIGVRPDDPPLVWEAWGGEDWLPVRVYSDDTGGLNFDGSIVLMLPYRHKALTLGGERAFWVRCRLVQAEGEQEPYRASPRISSLDVVGLGGTIAAHNAHRAPGEALGASEGRPGQRFTVQRSPVLPRNESEVVTVDNGSGPERWQEVGSFADSQEGDRHYTWDSATGTITFGPQVRHTGGDVVQHGAIPSGGSRVAVTSYRYGGGITGNVGAGTITVLKTSIPYIARVENLDAARGGVSPETVGNAMLRGPMTLRTGNRAVTIADFERLALDATPEVARARCLPPSEPGGPVRLLIVPHVSVPPEDLTLEHLVLPDHLVAEVAQYVDVRRVLTSTVEIRPPFYQGVTAAVTVRAAPGTQPEFVRDAVLRQLYHYMNPHTGGADGKGWPFGADLDVGELFSVLFSIEGVVSVNEVLLFHANLRTGKRDEPRQRVRLRSDALLASYQHQVRVL